MRRFLSGAAVAGLLAAGLAVAPVPASAVEGVAAEQAITELIVAYEPGVTPTEAPGIATGATAIGLTNLRTGRDIGLGMRTVHLPEAVDEETAQRIADRLAQAPGVRVAAPNSVVTLSDTQTSPPWGLDRIDQRSLPLDGLYTYRSDSTGQGVTAYVIDTGILTTHTEFTGRLAAGYDGIADGRGTSDCDGHGTHVAGILGGTTYGVAKDVTLVPVRVFDCSGSTTVDVVIGGIDWVISNHASGTPAVANMSLGGGANIALDDAVTRMIADGVTTVVASGNEATNSCDNSPARVPAAITVNASGAVDAAASFTNFGSCSDLYAPGVDILSAWYTSSTASATLNGTSMAAPHAAGVAARLLDTAPSLTPTGVWNAMRDSATSVAFAPGSGDPDLLLFADQTPNAPTSVSSTVGNSAIAVAWQAPTSNGASAVTSYTARAWSAPTGGTSAGTCTPSPATGLGCTLTGLANGTTYYVDVTATNSIGAGPATARVAATPDATLPSQPRSVTTSAANGSLAVTWQAPVSDGGIPLTSSTATAWRASTGGTSAGTCTPSPATSLSCTITGLANGTTYYVDVTASNGTTGLPSSPRVSGAPVAPAPPAPAPPAPAPPPSGGGGSSGGSASDSGGGGGSIWTVTEVRPAFGPTTGGSTILVLGWGFTGATGVSVAGTMAPGFRFVNDGTIEIVTPPAPVGWQELRVWLPNGSVPASFEYRAEPAPTAAAPTATDPTVQPDSTATDPTAGATRVGSADSPIMRPTAAVTAATPVRALRKPPARTVRAAPAITARTGSALRISVTGLPTSTRTAVRIRIDGRYVTLGTVRATAAGRAVLPAFLSTEPGTFLLRLTPAGGKPVYVKAAIR